MKSCKKLCLVSSCSNKVAFYANFSRYHSFCSIHKPDHTQEFEIFCENCKNSIKVFPNLPLADKVSYKKSLLPPVVEKQPSDKKSSKNQLQCDVSPSGDYPMSPGPAEKNPMNNYFNFASNLKSETSALISKSPSVSSMAGSSVISALSRSIQVNTEKCSNFGCSSKNTQKVCDSHAFCPVHLKQQTKTCNQCKCNFCSSYNVTIRKCGIKVCGKCDEKLKCCFKCCKRTDSPVQDCGHHLCEQEDKRRMCPCMFCTECGKSDLKKRSCRHRICDSCEVDGKCIACITGNCQNCGNFRPLEVFKCSLHSFCRDCTIYSKECPLCRKTCTRCLNVFYDTHVNCMQHPLCTSCRSEFRNNECIYCNPNYQEFICQSCQLTYGQFISHECGHRICNKCSALSCNHLSCGICFRSNNICFICHKYYYCKSCKRIDASNVISCNHGLCFDCGSRAFDEHYVCKKCNDFQYFHNGKCLKCEGSICDQCFAVKVLKNLSCGHKICESCYSAEGECLDCRPLLDCQFCEKKTPKSKSKCEHIICQQCSASINQPFCLKCSKTEEKFQCSFCLLFSDNLNILSCQHKACVSCSIVNNDHYCELCCVCMACLKLSPKASLNCQDLLCIHCAPDCQNGLCPVCSGELKLCDKCGKYSKTYTCPDNHSGCADCSSILFETRGIRCELCTYDCSYCKKPEGFSSLSCGHVLCKTCISRFESYQGKCLKCDPDPQNTCQTCEKVLETQLIKTFTCGHRLCFECCPSKVCSSCHKKICRDCEEKRKYQHFEARDSRPETLNKTCTHVLCHDCELHCEDCGKFICVICSEGLSLNNWCPHSLCPECIQRYNGNQIKCQYCQTCQKCKTVACIKTGTPCEHEDCARFKITNCIYCNPNKLCVKCFDSVKKEVELCDRCFLNKEFNECFLSSCKSCNTEKFVSKSSVCGHFYCRDCISNGTCSDACLICKAVPEFKCDHKICRECLSKGSCASCKLCEMCSSDLSSVISSCAHNLCERCIQSKCSLCLKSNDSNQVLELLSDINTSATVDNSRISEIGSFTSINLNNLNSSRSSLTERSGKIVCFKCCKDFSIESLCPHTICDDCKKRNACGCFCNYCDSNKEILKKKCGHLVCKNHSLKNNCKQCYMEKCINCSKSNNDKYQANCGKHLFCTTCSKNSCTVCLNSPRSDFHHPKEFFEREVIEKQKTKAKLEEKLHIKYDFKSHVQNFNFKLKLKSKLESLVKMRQMFSDQCENLINSIKNLQDSKLQIFDNDLKKFDNLINQEKIEIDEFSVFIKLENVKNIFDFEDIKKLSEKLAFNPTQDNPEPQLFKDFKFLSISDEYLAMSLENQIEVIEINSNIKDFKSFSLNGHQNSIVTALFLSNNSLLSGSEDGSILLWDLKERSLKEKIIQNQDSIKYLSISPNEDFFIFKTKNEEMQKFSFKDKELSIFSIINEPIENFQMTPDFSCLVSWTENSIKKLKIKENHWDSIEKLNNVRSVFLSDDKIYCLGHGCVEVISTDSLRYLEKFYFSDDFSIFGMFKQNRLVMVSMNGNIQLLNLEDKSIDTLLNLSDNKAEKIKRLWIQSNKIIRLDEGSLDILEIN